MSRLYKRVVKVSIGDDGGGETYEGLRVDFNCDLQISGTANTAKISIYNLASNTRKRLKREFTKIRLEVGYEDNTGVIFNGTLRDFVHDKNGPTIKTSMECGDGDKAIRQAHAHKSFPTGTKPKEIYEYLVERLQSAQDIDIGEMKGLDNLPAYEAPVTMWGPAASRLNELGRTHNVFWSIQNGTFETIPSDGFIEEVTIISKKTGMVGIPKITDNGVNVTCLINPQLRPNRIIDVRSSFVDSNRSKEDTDSGGGQFRIDKLNFNGNSHDGPFYAVIDGSRIGEGPSA